MAFPSPANDYAGERITFGSLVTLKSESSFIIVSGTDYPDEGIMKGSLLVVDRSLKPRHRQIVIAHPDDEMLILRYIQEPVRSLETISDNRRVVEMGLYQEAMQESELIWGVVAYVLTDKAGLGFNTSDTGY